MACSPSDFAVPFMLMLDIQVNKLSSFLLWAGRIKSCTMSQVQRTLDLDIGNLFCCTSNAKSP